MKQSLTILFLGLFFIGFTSCGEDEPLEIGDPSNKIMGITDEFELTRVLIFDNITPFDDNSLDISQTVIGETPMVISFDGETARYEVQAGTSRNIFGEGGVWSFDDPQFPTLLTLSADSGGPFVSSRLLQTIRPQDDQLQFSIDAGCDGRALTYEYYFTRK